MHSGFATLRNEMAMCIRERVDVRPWSDALVANIARVDEIWTESRRRFGAGGDYLCGAFSLADAFYGPVAFRYQTYGVQPAGEAGAYLRTRCWRIPSCGSGGRGGCRNRHHRCRRTARSSIAACFCDGPRVTAAMDPGSRR
jgi:hypothetical protein